MVLANSLGVVVHGVKYLFFSAYWLSVFYSRTRVGLCQFKPKLILGLGSKGILAFGAIFKPQGWFEKTNVKLIRRLCILGCTASKWKEWLRTIHDVRWSLCAWSFASSVCWYMTLESDRYLSDSVFVARRRSGTMRLTWAPQHARFQISIRHLPVVIDIPA